MRGIHTGKAGSSGLTAERYVFVFGFMILVAGCAGGQQLAEQERASIRTVSINQVKCDTLKAHYTKNLKHAKVSQLNELALKTFGIAAYRGGQIPEEFMPLREYVLLSPAISGQRTIIRDPVRKNSVVLEKPKSISFLDRSGRGYKVDLFHDPICYIIQDKKLWLVPSNVDSTIMQYWIQGGLEPRAMIYFAMARNNIDVGQMFREKFTAELRSRSSFYVVPEGGDAEFSLTCGWSFEGKAPGLSEQLKPFVDVRGTLVRSYGDLVWKGRGYTHYLSGKTPSHTIEEYLNDPELIRETVGVASQFAVEELVESLLK